MTRNFFLYKRAFGGFLSNVFKIVKLPSNKTWVKLFDTSIDFIFVSSIKKICDKSNNNRNS